MTSRSGRKISASGFLHLIRMLINNHHRPRGRRPPAGDRGARAAVALQGARIWTSRRDTVIIPNRIVSICFNVESGLIAHECQAAGLSGRGGDRSVVPMDSNSQGLEALLREVARLLERRLERDARASGLTGPRWRVLAHLVRHEGISQIALAESLGVVPIAIARIIDRLQAAGLVERRENPNDRRAWLLYPTSQARSRVEAMERLSSSTRDEFAKGISDVELKRLGATLLHLKANLDRISGKSV